MMMWPLTRWLAAFAMLSTKVTCIHSVTDDVQAQLQRRDAEVQEKLRSHAPVGIPKMSYDEGEKFYMDYWLFDDEFDMTRGQAVANSTSVGSNSTTAVVKRGNWGSACTSGYTSCPGGPNGGCCWPGYYCENGQCKSQLALLVGQS